VVSSRHLYTVSRLSRSSGLHFFHPRFRFQDYYGNAVLPFLTVLEACRWPGHLSATSASTRSSTETKQAMSRSSAARGGQYDTKYASSEWIWQAAFMGEIIEPAHIIRYC
ncbi:unnamed protein product, partial [Laminaria digitata]